MSGRKGSTARAQSAGQASTPAAAPCRSKAPRDVRSHSLRTAAPVRAGWACGWVECGGKLNRSVGRRTSWWCGRWMPRIEGGLSAGTERPAIDPSTAPFAPGKCDPAEGVRWAAFSCRAPSKVAWHGSATRGPRRPLLSALFLLSRRCDGVPRRSSRPGEASLMRWLRRPRLTLGMWAMRCADGGRDPLLFFTEDPESVDYIHLTSHLNPPINASHRAVAVVRSRPSATAASHPRARSSHRHPTPSNRIKEQAPGKLETHIDRIESDPSIHPSIRTTRTHHFDSNTCIVATTIRSRIDR